MQPPTAFDDFRSDFNSAPVTTFEISSRVPGAYYDEMEISNTRFRKTPESEPGRFIGRRRINYYCYYTRKSRPDRKARRKLCAGFFFSNRFATVHNAGFFLNGSSTRSDRLPAKRDRRDPRRRFALYNRVILAGVSQYEITYTIIRVR